MNLPSKVKHSLHCAVLLAILIYFEYFAAFPKKDANNETPDWKQYGVAAVVVLYIFKLLILLSFPQTIFNFCGLMWYNAFPDKVVLKNAPLLAPAICIRIVTRGDFPDLVKENVSRNLKTCSDVGLESFIIEVVSDKPIGLKPHPRVREVVVFPEYQTKTGALFKARALQYCLEEKINMLDNSDWIVHLDEETLLTENCVKGILNFIIEGKHHIGQGLITYANEEIVNWLTTLIDCMRVADDMGKLRFQFKVFHKPLFSFKGSYVVCQVGTEKDVTFDNGPEGSVAEDCYFAIKAFSKGYTFGFIEGEMCEKSPFTVKDFIQQRKRWLQGIMLVVHSKNIPIKYKLLLSCSCYAWITLPLQLTNIIIPFLFPLQYSSLLNVIVSFVGAVNLYMFIFGFIKSFNARRLGRVKYVIYLVSLILVIPSNMILESVAVLWGYFGNKHKFYVVQKS